MYRHLFPQRLVDAVKRRPLVHRAARSVRMAAGGLLPPREFPGIPGRIHPNGFMFDHAAPEEVASHAKRAGNVVASIEAASRQRLLVAHRAQVRQAVAAIGEHHRQIADHAAGVVPASALRQPRQRARQLLC